MFDPGCEGRLIPGDLHGGGYVSASATGGGALEVELRLSPDEPALYTGPYFDFELLWFPHRHVRLSRCSP